ncbi:arylesterase [Desulfomicrobium sp. ZS1]|uniref:arylesterase n=1 Tax=Desulfomicrobium sp. ZS1 TaxID=2952228 RepID=UPI0020B207FF|nr:arylesterase [Desulfomicrobium sp. ZS1]UTF51342.1 arylesterase [Desulfomicrobium sp. ZS1]
MSSILIWSITWAAALIVLCPVRGACAEPEIHILAFGDSLTAGYNLPPSKSFAAQLEERVQSQGRKVRVTNAGLSGDTTSGGRTRLAWSLQDKPDLIILELGANDGLRGLDPVFMRENLDAMIQECLNTGARVILAGMRAPVNWGEAYRTEFEKVFPELAEKYGLPLYPFFLEGVITNPALLLEDGLHPNANGVERIVDGILPLVLDEVDGLMQSPA